jgi:hypothetical protein
MKKLLKIDTISIKKKNGTNTIRINGNKITSYDINGASFLANEIEALPVNDLGLFHPIVVEFDEVFTKDAGLKHIGEHVVASLIVIDDSKVEAFITFMDPADIEEKGLHEKFQLTLEKVVKEEQHIELYLPVKCTFSKKELKILNSAVKKPGDSGPEFNFSEVGYVQFTCLIRANTFNEIFHSLNRIISRLERSTRSKMKKEKS